MLERQRLPLNIKEEMAVMERLHAGARVSIERLRTGGLVVPAAPCPWFYPDVIFPAPEMHAQEGEAKIRSLVALHHELIWEHPLRDSERPLKSWQRNSELCSGVALQN
jgi:hypothetical protein